MSVYIILGRLTHKAIAEAKGFRDRDKMAEEIIRSAGGRLLSHYYTFGRYDFVAVVDLPTPEALVKVLVEVGKWGTVSTETLNALPAELVYKATASE